MLLWSALANISAYMYIFHILTGESPEETRKLVAYEQIEHGQSSVPVKEQIWNSLLQEKCQCVRNARVGVRA